MPWLLASWLLAYGGVGYGQAEPCWRGFLVAVLEVVDGDTVDVEATWYPRHTAVDRVRVAGVDSPELAGETHAAGVAARAFTAKWLADSGATEVMVCGRPRDAFGRLLARIVSISKGDLGAALLAAGHAVPYAR
jgi:endonuclease YncB( thermonuclease family)